jgi:hypothetical protein
MTLTNRLSRVSDRVGSEQIMLLAMLSIAVYMFIGSYSFSWAAAFFPRIMASATALGVLLLLFRNYLPAALKQYVSTSVSIVNEDVRTEQIEEQVGDRSDETDQTPEMIWGSSPGFVTVLLMGAYIFGSYLVGMLWVTPFFVAAYLLWFEVRWLYVAILSAFSFGLAYTFMRLLLIDIDSGLLFDGGMLL